MRKEDSKTAAGNNKCDVGQATPEITPPEPRIAISTDPHNPDDAEVLKNWLWSMKLMMIGDLVKAAVRVVFYAAIIFLFIIFLIKESPPSCTITWLTYTETVANLQNAYNIVNCDRGYDIFDSSSAAFDVKNADACMETVSLTIDTDNCKGALVGNVFPAPIALFVDVEFEGYSYTHFEVGDPSENGIANGVLDTDQVCYYYGKYIYPCERELLNIYNDSISISDASGITLDASSDIVPLYELDVIRKDLPKALIETPTEPYYEWIPTSIFPGGIENNRVKTWSYFSNRVAIDPGFSDSTLEALPIGLILEDLTLPLTIEIQDRWFSPKMPASFTKRLRLTSPKTITNLTRYLIVGTLGFGLFLLLEVIFVVSKVIMMGSLKHITTKHQIAQWITNTSDPITNIGRYSNPKSSAFEIATEDYRESQSRVSFRVPRQQAQRANQ